MSQPTGTYSHERLGISFSYPVDWSIDASDPAFIQLSLGEDTFVRIQSRLPGPVTLDTVISQFVRDFSVVSGFREISRSPTNNSSAPGLLISVEWLAENTPFRGDFTLLVEGARVFSLGAIAPEESFDQHRADFELVMNSFKITLSPTKRLVGIGGEVEGILDDIGARVSRIRGLPSLTGLENRLLTRGELIARAKSELLDGETRREAELLKSLCVILDLCSESDDMLKLLLSLQAQGALGYYKSEEDSLTVVTDQAEPDLLSFLTYAHEYTHALQDRRFGLPLIGPEEKTFDSSRAVGALVEGDSKLVEYLFYDSMPPEQQTLLLDLLDRAVKRFSMSPEAARAPRIIIETFSWEQTNGFDFVFSLYLEGGSTPSTRRSRTLLSLQNRSSIPKNTWPEKNPTPLICPT